MPRRSVFLYKERRACQRAWLAQLGMDAEVLRSELAAADHEIAAEAGRLGARLTHLAAQKKADAKETEALVRDWYWLVRGLLRKSLSGQPIGRMYPRLLDHTARKAMHVRRCLAAKGSSEPRWDSTSAQEMVFFLRLLSDEAQLFLRWLDPSEQALAGGMSAHGAHLDGLIAAGREYASLLAHEEGGASVLRRYLTECRDAVGRFGAFLAQVQRIAEESVLLGVFPQGAFALAAAECELAEEAARMLLSGAGGTPEETDAAEEEPAEMPLERTESVVLTPLVSDAGETDAAEECAADMPCREEPKAAEEESVGETSAEEKTAEGTPPAAIEPPMPSAEDVLPPKERIFGKASDHKNIVGKLIEKTEPLSPLKKPRTLGRIR